MIASNGHTPRETPRALAAYRSYELMGPERSLAKLSRHLIEASLQTNGNSSVKLRQLEVWSSVHHWQDRVRAYDEEQAKARQQRRQAELDRMNDEMALVGRSHLLRAVRLIEKHIEEGTTTFAGAIQLLKVAANLERVARGAATERVIGEMTVPPKEYIILDDWHPDQDGRDP